MSVLQEAQAIVQRAVEKAIKKGDEVGTQICAYYDGKVLADVALGTADVKTGKPVTKDTLFNIWSVSKGAIATCIHVQAEKGLVDYDTPLAHYWPEFGAHGKGGITVRHVLMHRSGMPHMPEDVTPETIVDWEWMTKKIAALKPLCAPGEKPMYQAISFGWLLGEVVRRTDPKKRDVNTFLQEEINKPLGIDGLWLGVPPDRLDRIAEFVDNMLPMDPAHLPPLFNKASPWAVRLTADVFSDNLLRKGNIPAVGGIANARSTARLFAMMANGGELDGVRILSRDRVAKFNQPRQGGDEPDEVMFNQPMPLSMFGYWLYAPAGITLAMRTPTAYGNPGVGNSLAWADPDNKLAVGFCHNRLFQPPTPEQDPLMPMVDAIHEAVKLVRGDTKMRASA